MISIRLRAFVQNSRRLSHRHRAAVYDSCGLGGNYKIARSYIRGTKRMSMQKMKNGKLCVIVVPTL